MEQIGNLSGKNNKPRIVLGDLNEFSSPKEKFSINKGNSTRYNIFNNFIDENDLIVLGFTSNHYTWHNKREEHVGIFSHLDRALANHLWINLHPSSSVKHLPNLALIMPPY